MNSLTSQQRKLLYVGGIVVLLIPILVLGQPSDGKKAKGGMLPQLREQYSLGETDLGNVDASSAAMNLVLLGMRGVAVNMLWMDLDVQKDMKRWAEMQATTESIVRLQPHFIKVWDYNGHNLAYNTSAEWDAVPDRFYWVKQGAKFLQRGVDRNLRATELYYLTGKVMQHKVGYADESIDYRKYFVSDPDPAFKGGPDPVTNPDGLDNFLVAKKWYSDAVDREQKVPQHILERALFLNHPARCQFDYAQALQKDGKFEETTRVAWEQARIDWTKGYGRKEIIAIMPRYNTRIMLEMTEEEIKAQAKSPEEEEMIRQAVNQYQKMANYNYWRVRAYAEAENETAEAHRSLFEAKQSYKAQEFDKSEAAAFKGMQGFEKILQQPEYASLTDEDLLCEECMLGWRIWEDIHQVQGRKLPAEYPLKWLVEMKMGNDQIMKNVNKEFKKMFLEAR